MREAGVSLLLAVNNEVALYRKRAMPETSRFVASASGVRIASDFRDNLIIDRYDPVFATMRAKKRKHLQSENSEDAVTWNVFRSLRQIEPRAWLPKLADSALRGWSIAASEDPPVVRLWCAVCPPPSLLTLGDEGDSEIDVVIETGSWVWFIEAKYRSDISTRTTTRPLRDQVLRNIDVGSYYAGVRQFYFSLLIRDPARSPLGVQAVERYADLAAPRQLLSAHRPDGLANLVAVTLVTWGTLGEVLRHARDVAAREDERGYAERALAWLEHKGLTLSRTAALP